MEGPRWSRAETAVLAVGVVLLLAFTFPLYAIANRVEPILLGLPFGMLWIVAWIVIGGVALLLIYRAEQRANGSDGDR